MKLKQGDMIKIIWLDAFNIGGWNSIKDVEHQLENYIKCEIIGYYIKEDKNFMVLAMGLQDDLDSLPFLHLEFIPKKSILEIDNLIVIK